MEFKVHIVDGIKAIVSVFAAWWHLTRQQTFATHTHDGLAPNDRARAQPESRKSAAPPETQPLAGPSILLLDRQVLRLIVGTQLLPVESCPLEHADYSPAQLPTDIHVSIEQ